MGSFSKYVKSQDENVKKLFGKLFSVRQNAHILHLNSKSYAEHIALNEFYDKLIELADELIEVYQGQYNLVQIKPENQDFKSAQEMLEDFASTLENCKSSNSHLANLIDEIKALTYKTLYKVRFLK